MVLIQLIEKKFHDDIFFKGFLNYDWNVYYYDCYDLIISLLFNSLRIPLIIVTVMTQVQVCYLIVCVAISLIMTVMTQVQVCYLIVCVAISLIMTVMTQVQVCYLIVYVAISLIMTVLTQVQVCYLIACL